MLVHRAENGIEILDFAVEVTERSRFPPGRPAVLEAGERRRGQNAAGETIAQPSFERSWLSSRPPRTRLGGPVGRRARLSRGYFGEDIPIEDPRSLIRTRVLGALRNPGEGRAVMDLQALRLAMKVPLAEYFRRHPLRCDRRLLPADDRPAARPDVRIDLRGGARRFRGRPTGCRIWDWRAADRCFSSPTTSAAAAVRTPSEFGPAPAMPSSTPYLQSFRRRPTPCISPPASAAAVHISKIGEYLILTLTRDGDTCASWTRSAAAATSISSASLSDGTLLDHAAWWRRYGSCRALPATTISSARRYDEVISAFEATTSSTPGVAPTSLRRIRQRYDIGWKRRGQPGGARADILRGEENSGHVYLQSRGWRDDTIDDYSNGDQRPVLFSESPLPR